MKCFLCHINNEFVKDGEIKPKDFFVVEDVDWLKHQEDSFGDIIVRMFEGDSENDNLQEELYTELVEKFLDDIKKTYSDSVASIEERITGPLVEQLTDELITQLQN